MRQKTAQKTAYDDEVRDFSPPSCANESLSCQLLVAGGGLSGLSAAEAMSAGCVPVVVGRGGLTEVVGPELLEWTWQSWDECVEKTRVLIENPELRRSLAEKARHHAEGFAFPSFQERVRELVRGLRAA